MTKQTAADLKLREEHCKIVSSDFFNHFPTFMFFLYVDIELKTDCTFECSDIKKKKQHASVCVGEHLIFSASLMSRNGKLWPLGRIFKSVSLLNFKIRHRLLYSLSQGHKLFN